MNARRRKNKKNKIKAIDNSLGFLVYDYAISLEHYCDKYNLALIEGVLYGAFYGAFSPTTKATPPLYVRELKIFNPHKLHQFDRFIELVGADSKRLLPSIFRSIHYCKTDKYKWEKSLGKYYNEYVVYCANLERRKAIKKRNERMDIVKRAMLNESSIPECSPAQLRVCKQWHDKRCGVGVITHNLHANMGSCQCGDVNCRIEVDYENRTVKVLSHDGGWMKGYLQNSTYCVPYTVGFDLPYSNFKVIKS